MSTALTAYLSNTNDTLLTTARKLLNAAPSSETSVAATGALAKNTTGWIVLATEGGSSTTLSATEPAVNGDGSIWDATTLEGQEIVAGSWTPKVKLSVGGGSLVADIHVRIWKRSSTGTYTQFTASGVATDCVLSAQTISTTATVFTFAATTLDAMSFATGDKLYIDYLLNITTGNGFHTTEPVTLYENGGANESVATPGYQVATTPIALSGSTSSTTTTHGTLSASYRVIGAISSVTSLSGTLSSAQHIDGSVMSVSSLGAALTVAMTLSGSTTTLSSTTGALSISTSTPIPLAGNVASSTSSNGTLSQSQSLSGYAGGASSLSGTLSNGLSLYGTFASTSSVGGALAVAKSLQGSLSSLSNMTGAVSLAIAITGSVSSSSNASGALSVVTPGVIVLAGGIVSTSTAIGLLDPTQANHVFAGAVAVSGTLSATVQDTAILTSGCSVVNVDNVTGDYAIYFTVDAIGGQNVDAAVGGANCYVLPASKASVNVRVSGGSGVVVNLISSGTPGYAVSIYR